MTRATKIRIWATVHGLSVALLYPLNAIYLRWLAPKPHPNSVLHVSYMVHVPHHTVELLRRHGMKADYLALGGSSVWSTCDYRFDRSRWPFVAALQETLWLWRVLARYEAIHSHFALSLSRSGWEMRWLRRLGRRIVVHYRGCEARDREANMRLHPDLNICSDCDYMPRICQLPEVAARRRWAEAFGDVFLVTTPDLLDFVPNAVHLPFLHPLVDTLAAIKVEPRLVEGPVRIVHATNHPGIEATSRIRAVVDRLRDRGFAVELEVLHGASHDEVLRAFAAADVTIGKLKMGYYANAQIESLALGVPAVTWVRDAFRTPELDEAFVFADPDELEEVLAGLLSDPDRLARLRGQARARVAALHDNDAVARRLIDLYREGRP